MPENYETPEEKLAARRASSRSAEAERDVRQPQDRQPKKRKKASAQATELEFRGVIYPVYPEVLDDWELLEEASEKGDAGNMMIMKAYLGESYNEVKEDLRDEETGRVSKDDMVEFFEVVGDQIKNLK